MIETFLNSVMLFLSSYIVVLLLGFQSQIVRLGHKKMAFALSLGVGISQVFAFKLVPAANTVELISFVLGGALGIVSSITVHEMYVKHRGINDTRGIGQ